MTHYAIRCRAALSVAAILLAAAPCVRASNLQAEVSLIAKDLAAAIRAAGEDAVAIGQFTGPPQQAVNAGPGIAKLLGDELGKQNIRIKARTRLGIKGEFCDVIDADSDQLAAKLRVELVDRRGARLKIIERGVFGDATLAALFGITTPLPPEVGSKQRAKLIEDWLNEPSCHIDGCRVRSSATSPYGIEIWVKQGKDRAARKPVAHERMAYVSLARDESYAVRLINDSPYEAAVTLTVDGISMFAFSDHRGYSQVIVPPQTSTLIQGWHRTNTWSEEFSVTEYSKSAAAELNAGAGNLGVITACFAAAWNPDAAPPPDEPSSPDQYARSADATGRGPRVEAQYVEVARKFGVIRDTVSVRYAK